MTVRLILFIPKRHESTKKQSARFLYYYSYLLCKSIKELFLKCLSERCSSKAGAK